MNKYNFTDFSALIMDENFFMRETLSRLLGSIGIESVSEVSSIQQANQILKEVSFDVLFLEWVEGSEGTLEIVNLIRSSIVPVNPYIPIILVTSKTFLHNIYKARDSGINEILAKPYSVENLVKKMITSIENPRQFIDVDAYRGPDRRRKSLDSFGGNDRRNSLTSFEEKDFDSIDQAITSFVK